MSGSPPGREGGSHFADPPPFGKNDRIPLPEPPVEKGSGTKTHTASFANGRKRRKQLGIQAGNKQIMLIHATGYYAVIKIML